MADTYSLIEQLAKHLQRPVEKAVRDHARLHLLDWLACVAGARKSGLLDMLRSAATPVMEKAAFLGNVLEMDDVHRAALLHPGPVIWPGVIDAGQNMDACLDAAVRGYEAMICVGATFDAHHYAHFHPTATAGPFGAAAAAASLRGCNEDQTGAALALAGSVTGGLWQTRHEPVTAKQWHVAHAVLTGQNAARFAQCGVTGPRFVLEGPQGLFAATCTHPGPLITEEGWRINDVSFKPWAACRHAHPVIDCALKLRDQGKLSPPYHVETYGDSITFCDRQHPENEAQAKFSLHHAVAVIADGRNADPADFEPGVIAALASARDQVTVAEAPEFSALYPAHFGARLVAGGGTVTVKDTKGDPEQPLSLEEIIAKVRTLARWGGLADDEADRAIDLALNGAECAPLSIMLEDWL